MSFVCDSLYAQVSHHPAAPGAGGPRRLATDPNDCTSLAAHGDESVSMSNPSDQYRTDTRRRSDGEDGPIGHTPQGERQYIHKSIFDWKSINRLDSFG